MSEQFGVAPVARPAVDVFPGSAPATPAEPHLAQEPPVSDWPSLPSSERSLAFHGHDQHSRPSGVPNLAFPPPIGSPLPLPQEFSAPDEDPGSPKRRLSLKRKSKAVEPELDASVSLAPLPAFPIDGPNPSVTAPEPSFGQPVAAAPVAFPVPPAFEPRGIATGGFSTAPPEVTLAGVPSLAPAHLQSVPGFVPPLQPPTSPPIPVPALTIAPQPTSAVAEAAPASTADEIRALRTLLEASERERESLKGQLAAAEGGIERAEEKVMEWQILHREAQRQADDLATSLAASEQRLAELAGERNELQTLIDQATS